MLGGVIIIFVIVDSILMLLVLPSVDGVADKDICECTTFCRVDRDGEMKDRAIQSPSERTTNTLMMYPTWTWSLCKACLVLLVVVVAVVPVWWLLPLRP
jgi:hypothetical protein